MRSFTKIAVLALLYTLAGKWGLQLALVNASATAVWPPAGIALAALLVLGFDAWPGILVGAFLVNASTAGTFATSLGIAVGNTAEALAAAYGVHRLAHGTKVFEHSYDVFKFAVIAALGSSLIGATVGVTTLALGGFASWADYGRVWVTWWLGDAGGILIVTPLLVLWACYPSESWTPRKAMEAGIMAAALIIVGIAVFGGGFREPLSHYPLEFLCTPIVIWAAFRLGRREAATTTFLLAILAVGGTLRGLGPFATGTKNTSLLLLQAYLGVVSTMSLAVAAVVAERQRAKIYLEEQVQKRTSYLNESLNILRREVTERERAELALRASEKRYQQLLKSNIMGTMVVDWDGRVVDANDAFLRMLGYSHDDLEKGKVGGPAMTPPEYRAVDDWARAKLKETGVCPPLEKEYVRKDGTRVPVLVGAIFHEEPEEKLVCLVIDASDRRKAMEALRAAYDDMETRVAQRTAELAAANTELTREVERRKRAEASLQSLVITDPLTGLYNRRGFTTLADQLLKQARRTRLPFLLFVADLDGLKKINDGFGHLEGDHAINAAASILKDTFRASDVIARIGGDEFAIAVVEDRADFKEQPLLKRLREKQDEFNQLAKKNYAVSLSIGSARLRFEDDTSLEALVSHADDKLYNEKRNKKSIS